MLVRYRAIGSSQLMRYTGWRITSSAELFPRNQRMRIDMKTTMRSAFWIAPLALLILFTTAQAARRDDPVEAGEKNEVKSEVKVSFDEQVEGVAYVEVNGQRIRIDTRAKTYARVEA